MAEATGAAVSVPPGYSSELWEEAGYLECELSVELPVHGFTVRDLLQLAAGSIVETQWKNAQDMPLRASNRQIGWVEFEAVGETLSVRITELV